MSTLIVRMAMPGDLKGIVQVEEESWGEGVGAAGVASPRTLQDRIQLCNASPPGWFWVAEEEDGRIVGDFVLQPTRMPPEECVSWAMATDSGSLLQTFEPSGSYVYGVSLGVVASAPPGTADLLVHAIHALRIASGKKVLYACARMSGFRRAHRRTGISPEEYWLQRKEDGTPKDPFLWHFETMIGLRPSRFLKDGYPPDADSGGHGVLCVSTDPLHDLLVSARRLSNLKP